MVARFKFLIGDVNWSDYGGKFYRRVSPGRFHIMEVINWHEHDSNPKHTYHVDLAEVDLGAASKTMVTEAHGYYGWTDADDVTDLMTVEALHSYGYKAPLWDESGNNLKKLMAEARAESKNLDDPSTYEHAMNRPVNKIGSTAREYAQGDVDSAMERGVRSGDQGAKIMAKMHGNSDESIAAVEADGPKLGSFGFSVNMKKVPSDDPLAFTIGYMHAMGGSSMGDGESESDLATEYVRGYHLGVDVKAGRAEHPTWC